VIVDRETMVVLDGAHRVTALRMLGCRYACAGLVDYMGPQIELGGWLRTISRPMDAEEAAEVAEKCGLDLIPIESVDRRDFGFPVLRLEGGSAYLLVPASDTFQGHEVLGRFEQGLKVSGHELGYESDLHTGGPAENAPCTVIQPPSVRKEQVVETARSGRVMASKATRHTIPGRPVGVDVPLSLLRDRELDVEEANARLSSMMEGKAAETLPPGTTWRGRKYDETLLTFTENAEEQDRVLKTQPFF
jgi:hypothetical protein